MVGNVFNRVEKKYLLDSKKTEALMKAINEYIIPGEYPYTKVCNIYFDTDNKELIRKSISKPLYKEKVRLRSYGTPSVEDKVYIEIKKKFKGVVTKRRVGTSLEDFKSYLKNGNIPKVKEKQIFKEVDYCFKKYELKPSMYISCERYSYCGKDDNSLRITFDTNIRTRDYDLKLENGDYGENLINDKTYLMEIKTLGGMPIWLTRTLSQLNIYPTSFSKYGKTYEKNLKEEKLLKIS